MREPSQISESSLTSHDRLLLPILAKLRERVVTTVGFLVEFDSSLDATNCVFEVQRFLQDHSVSSKKEWKFAHKVGAPLRNIEHREGDFFGDAVSIAR
jgi:class 3 adenylate cyclase